MKGCPFEYQRHGSPRELSPENGERVNLNESLVFAVFGVEMCGVWSLKYIRTTIPKNRVTSGISSLDSTFSARPAPGNLSRPHRPGGAASPAPRGPRLRCDCAVTSAVRGGVSDHRGIPTGLRTQPLRPIWTGLNWQPSGSTPVSTTIFSTTYRHRAKMRA